MHIVGKDTLSATIVVPTFNREQLLTRTLESLCAQRCDMRSFEVIVVDDGSSDDSFGVTRAFDSRINVKYVYQSDRGYRLARARNLGASLADGELLIFIDAGVACVSHFVRSHIDFHGDTKDAVGIGYVFGFSLDNNSHPEISVAVDNNIDASINRIGCVPNLLDMREEVYASCADDLSLLPAPWTLAWGCNLSFPRGLMERSGGFDENYRSWGMEDLDMGLALNNAGATFHLVRAAAALHLPHEKDLSENMRSAEGNKAYFLNKYNSPDSELIRHMGPMEVNMLPPLSPKATALG